LPAPPVFPVPEVRGQADSTRAVGICPCGELLHYIHKDGNEDHSLPLCPPEDVHALLPSSARHLIGRTDKDRGRSSQNRSSPCACAALKLTGGQCLSRIRARETEKAGGKNGCVPTPENQENQGRAYPVFVAVALARASAARAAPTRRRWRGLHRATPPPCRRHPFVPKPNCCTHTQMSMSSASFSSPGAPTGQRVRRSLHSWQAGPGMRMPVRAASPTSALRVLAPTQWSARVAVCCAPRTSRMSCTWPGECKGKARESFPKRIILVRSPSSRMTVGGPHKE
jgi:hypothetical protein